MRRSMIYVLSLLPTFVCIGICVYCVFWQLQMNKECSQRGGTQVLNKCLATKTIEIP
jgi:hypothetical protein